MKFNVRLAFKHVHGEMMEMELLKEKNNSFQIVRSKWYCYSVSKSLLQ